ncbi:GNAT family N-acetyltransferase [Clostridium sp. Cult2]|uniref:GNAT family N-acetyltransferase n=1 Tax=Clostridium sp. Cult2 TaxID=2079003 RepID=UPI001F343302|nr:GNAT family N-acetyltransferase [Clostridium sp. Cult2]
MEIMGERIRIAPLTLEDAYSMKNWGTHKNPLLSDYNLPSLNDEEIKEWYNYKTGSKNKKYYSVFNEENRLIGYMGIKSIRRIFKDSVLGIAFDPNYVNQGYGTETIITFLDYYFNEMKMKKMFLEVAEFNKRAIRCYEKTGFKKIDRYLAKFFNQRIDLENIYFINEKSSFVIEEGKVYNYIYKMKIDSNTYKKAREEVDELPI